VGPVKRKRRAEIVGYPHPDREAVVAPGGVPGTGGTGGTEDQEDDRGPVGSVGAMRRHGVAPAASSSAVVVDSSSPDAAESAVAQRMRRTILDLNAADFWQWHD